VKRLTALLVAIAAFSALAAPVSAATPLVLEKQMQFDRLFPSEPLCEDFTVTSQFQVTRTTTQYYDQEGTLLREVRHVIFTGSQTNDENGTSLPVNGTFHVVLDFVALTFTATGSARHVTVPGSGIVLNDSGRTVSSLIDDSPLFMAGPHQDLLGDYATICEALAGA
jgi:hypothetical protein